MITTMPGGSVFHTGDALTVLQGLPDRAAQMCVTSPPYFGLRDYGVAGQIGQETKPEAYIARLVDVFREVRRVMRDDGTLWVNIGDSSARGKPKDTARQDLMWSSAQSTLRAPGLKAKDLIGIPWMLAFALRADGWYLRSEIVWNKTRPMPESIRDRPARAHETIFLLSKSEKYFYDYLAVREPASESSAARWAQNVEEQDGSARGNGGAKTNGAMKAVGGPRTDKQRGHGRCHAGFNDRWDKMSQAEQMAHGRNQRDVWTFAPGNYEGAHFAVFPPELPRRCILAGSRVGDTVLDPFGGSGTTAQVARALGRKSILIDLNPDCVAMVSERLNADQGLLFDEAAA